VPLLHVRDSECTLQESDPYTELVSYAHIEDPSGIVPPHGRLHLVVTVHVAPDAEDHVPLLQE